MSDYRHNDQYFVTHNLRKVIKSTASGYIGKVYVRGLDVNREMVKRGAARYTPGSMPYEMDMEHAQDEAKRAQRGIWQKARPTYRW